MPAITSGDGNGEARITSERQLVVRSITELELEHASAGGAAYTWDSLELNIDTGDTMLHLTNDGDTPLILDRIDFNGSNVICEWTIGIGTTTTTATGTVVSGVNSNTSFESVAADATAFSDETAVADATVVGRVKTAVSGHLVYPMGGFIIGKNHYIQIIQETESTSGSVVLHGHFENPE